MGASMGRITDAVNFLRSLLDGRQDEHARAPWLLDDIEKVLKMWPEPSLKSSDLRAADEAGRVFFHLRRLYRYGFRLSVSSDGLRLRQFFADGEVYRPEGYRHDSEVLLAHVSGRAMEVGPCRSAPADSVLKALGFSGLDKKDSSAIQFGAPNSERWIFIDSRPDVFRRQVASQIAEKLLEIETRLTIPYEKGPEL